MISVSRSSENHIWLVHVDGKVIGTISYIQDGTSLEGEMSRISGDIPTGIYRKVRGLIKSEISSENFLALSKAIMNFRN